MVVGYYYDSQMYTNPANEEHKTKTNGEGLVHVNAEMFQKCANELPENIIETIELTRRRRYFQHRFCSAVYQGLSYFPEDNTLETEMMKNRRENDVLC